MIFEAFVYGWRNINNGKMYIGFRKNSDVNDGYVFSSEDQELKEAWSLGLLRRSILYRGDKITAITMERKLLKYGDARRNNKFYNRSNGGGAGIQDYKIITDEQAKIGIDWINGVDPVEHIDIFNFVDTDLVDNLWQSVKDKKYEVIEELVSEIVKFKHNQVRLIMIDHNHVRAISDNMIHDPVEARKNISPIIVCVGKDGSKTIIDGNHTSKAVIKAGWTSAPVIYINSSEFLDKKSNIDHFGIIANHNPQIKKPPTPQDCQRAIINLYTNNLEDQDRNFVLLDSDKFKTTCEEILHPRWTKSTISSNLIEARKRIKTNYAQAKLNFQTYSKTDLDWIVKHVEYQHPKLAVISVSSGAIYNAGIGAVINKMGGMNTWEGLIVTHHGNISEHDSWASAEEKLKEGMKRLHPKCNIKYVVLDSFQKQQTINF
jgi:hypothetical protein